MFLLLLMNNIWEVYWEVSVVKNRMIINWDILWKPCKKDVTLVSANEIVPNWSKKYLTWVYELLLDVIQKFLGKDQ